MKTNEFGKGLVCSISVGLAIAGLTVYAFQFGREYGKMESACDVMTKFIELELSIKDLSREVFDKTQVKRDGLFSLLLSHL